VTVIYDLIGFGISVSLYMFPTIIAHLRRHNTGGVAIINVLTGWTVIGWFVALVMACGARHDNRASARGADQ
jgi:hypothetical protein